MKRIISFLLAVITAFAIPCVAFAEESSNLTEEELWEQVANNTATVTHEVRSVDSFTQEEIAQNSDLQQIFGEINNSVSRTTHDPYLYGQIYTTTIETNSGQTVVYRSTPKVTFVVVDVGDASSASIYSIFEVVETVSVDGELNYGWNNTIRYKNVTGSMGCGINTQFTNIVTLDGNSSGTLTGNIKGLIGFFASVADCTTVSQILSAFDAISYTGSRVSSQTISSTNAEGDVIAVGAKMDNEVLFSNSHYLRIQSNISTTDSTKTANQSAKAAAKWTFDVYFAGYLTPAYSNQSVSVYVDYLVNVK